MKKKREWSLTKAMAHFAAMMALSPGSDRPIRRGPDPANCPVCGIEHRTGKIACCAEHGRAYRAERRHHSLPAKNGVKGRRHVSVRQLLWSDRYRYLAEGGHKHLTAMNNNVAEQHYWERQAQMRLPHAADDTSFQLAP